MSIKKLQVRLINGSSCNLTMAYMRHAMLVLSLGVLSIGAQAATYQTYVIHTYGGETLLPAVRQQLNNSRDGGSAANYQSNERGLHPTLGWR